MPASPLTTISYRQDNMASVIIPRLPGEGDLEYRRRSGRERQRLYRMAVPKSTKVRGPSKKMDPRCNWSEEDWLLTRRRPGETPKAYKKRYRLLAARLYTKYNKPKIAENAHARRSDPVFLERELAYKIEWQAANPEKVKAQQLRYLERHREERIAKLEAWGRANKDRLKEVQRLWWADNRGKARAYSAKWRKCCRVQLAPWADLAKIEAIYDEAVRITVESGVLQHVDHIIPLQGKTVCGLHVETNLRIIPAVENMKKRNFLIEELAYG